MVISVNIEGLSSSKQQILAELWANHMCDVVCMQETHRGPGTVRPRVRGMNLVAEIANGQYGCVLFIPAHVNPPPHPPLTILRLFKQH